MRKEKQELSEASSIATLNACTHGVLSVFGEDGYPYGVPISHAYKDGKLYLHSALSGHKVDAIKRNDKVSFTVVSQDDVIAEKFDTMYESVVVFGRAHIVTEDAEQVLALTALLEKFSPDFMEKGLKYIEAAKSRCLAIVIDIDKMTGKVDSSKVPMPI